MNRTQTVAIAAVAALAVSGVGFLAGRTTAEPEVVTKTIEKTVEVESPELTAKLAKCQDAVKATDQVLYLAFGNIDYASLVVTNGATDPTDALDSLALNIDKQTTDLTSASNDFYTLSQACVATD